jgi:hypothetical protein
MKKKFRFKLVAIDAKEPFKEGWEPGVLAMQEVEYDLEPEKYKSPIFIMEILEKEDEFMNETVEVRVEEIHETE